MLREKVIQYPTCAARLVQKSDQNDALPCWSSAEVENTLATPPPATNPQIRSATPPPIKSGAENDSNHFTPSMPVRMMTSCIAQKTTKAMKVCPGMLTQPPHATRALAMAAKLAPLTPKEARTKTGNGTPYLVSAWAFKSIGIRTSTLPREMVSRACHQFIPAAMRPEANR